MKCLVMVKNNNIRRNYNLSKIILGLAFLSFGFILYLMFYPLKPVELFPPFPVKTKTVKRGNNLIYTANYCRHTELSGRVARTLVNDLVWVLPEVATVNAPRGCGKVDISVKIPEEISLGKYYMRIKATYVMNAFRTYAVNSYTDSFEVIE